MRASPEAPNAPNAPAPGGGGLADLCAALSLATDLGNGLPLEKTLRTTLLAVGIGDRLGLVPTELADVYHLALLRSIACTSFAPEQAAMVAGDDVAARALMTPAHGDARPRVAARVVREMAAGAPPLPRAGAVLRFLASGDRLGDDMCLAHRDVGLRFAERLGASSRVGACLEQVWERYDGRGMPEGLAGEQLALASRIVHVAFVVELAHHAGGPAAARREARRRRGTHFDPLVVDAFCDDAAALLAEVAGEATWERVLAQEPVSRRLAPAGVDEFAAVLADFADLKCTFTLGHSSGVARLAAAAAPAIGADPDTVRRAALLHDLGRVAVPNRVWDRRGGLGAGDWERVRLHPYYTERVLSYSPLLEPYGRVAGMHHERLDGSGYHRGLAASGQPATARVLAVADALHAMTEERPHRPALALPDAAAQLRTQARDGRLDRDAVAAVLDAAGAARRPREMPWPADLTDREIDVLRRIAHGRSSRQVAAELVISKRTVDHHVAHIYRKIGVASRAGAALFAIEQGLLEPDAQ
jgi:putative nucleotidyltransferase with HDIG domain